MKKGILIFYIFVLASVTAKHLPFYRKDYVFLEEFDAFYKLHWNKDDVSWNLAFMTCDDEGSQLFYPKETGERMVVQNLSAMIRDASNFTDVIVGIHDEIGAGEFITVDGNSTPTPLNVKEDAGSDKDCVIMDLQTGIFKTESCNPDPGTKRLFVCKKVDEKPCPTIDLGYQFFSESKKCYKVNNREKTWQDAWYTCYMEGGLLVSPENSVEARVIYDYIMENNPDRRYFAGFRRIFPGGEFYNVKGKQLEQTYNLWYDRSNDGKEDCGVVYKYSNSLYLRTMPCHQQLSFICEMAGRA